MSATGGPFQAGGTLYWPIQGLFLSGLFPVGEVVYQGALLHRGLFARSSMCTGYHTVKDAFGCTLLRFCG